MDMRQIAIAQIHAALPNPESARSLSGIVENILGNIEDTLRAAGGHAYLMSGWAFRELCAAGVTPLLADRLVTKFLSSI